MFASLLGITGLCYSIPMSDLDSVPTPSIGNTEPRWPKDPKWKPWEIAVAILGVLGLITALIALLL